jgi:hypothetical protein
VERALGAAGAARGVVVKVNVLGKVTVQRTGAGVVSLWSYRFYGYGSELNGRSDAGTPAVLSAKELVHTGLTAYGVRAIWAGVPGLALRVDRGQSFSTSSRPRRTKL